MSILKLRTLWINVPQRRVYTLAYLKSQLKHVTAPPWSCTIRTRSACATNSSLVQFLQKFGVSLNPPRAFGSAMFHTYVAVYLFHGHLTLVVFLFALCLLLLT